MNYKQFFLVLNLSFCSVSMMSCCANCSGSPCESLEFSTSIGMELKLWHDDNYDKDVWNTITHNFEEFNQCCEMAKSRGDESGWLNILGPSFVALHSIVNKSQGLSGNLSVQLFPDKIHLALKYNHAEKYDLCAWQEVIKLFAIENTDFDQISEKDYDEIKNQIPLIEETLIGEAIDMAMKSFGIHGDFNFTAML